MGFQADCRAAACTLLRSYRDDAGVKLTVYEGRPRSLQAPHAFVDGMSEEISYETAIPQRTVDVDVIVVHGTFDTKDASSQRDAFVDGFIEWVDANLHAAGGRTTFAGVRVEDIPNFVPDWIAPAEQQVYYATRVTLQGFQGGLA